MLFTEGLEVLTKTRTRITHRQAQKTPPLILTLLPLRGLGAAALTTLAGAEGSVGTKKNNQLFRA